MGKQFFVGAIKADGIKLPEEIAAGEDKLSVEEVKESTNSNEGEQVAHTRTQEELDMDQKREEDRLQAEIEAERIAKETAAKVAADGARLLSELRAQVQAGQTATTAGVRLVFPGDA